MLTARFISRHGTSRFRLSKSHTSRRADLWFAEVMEKAANVGERVQHDCVKRSMCITHTRYLTSGAIDELDGARDRSATTPVFQYLIDKLDQKEF
jgi:hypothetical protein